MPPDSKSDLAAEVERQVAERTFRLEFANALLRSLYYSEEDAETYAQVADVVRLSFSASRVLLAYYDGAGELSAAHSPYEARERGSHLAVARARELAAAAEGEAFDSTSLGFGLVLPIAFGLAAQGDQAGYIAISRDGLPFTDTERASMREAFAAFAPLVRMREAWSRRESERRAAERELRRSEARLRGFFEESKDMIYTASSDDVIAAINAAGLALLGYDDRFDVIGRPMADFSFSRTDRAFFLKKLETQGFAADYECILVRKDDTPVYCLESATPLRDANGRILEIQGIVRDISDRIESERELWKNNLELAEANAKLRSTQLLMVQQEKLASIGQLAAGIAHEINNPLGFLKSNQRTLEEYMHAMRSGWEEAATSFPDAIAEISERHDLDYIFNETQALLAESDDGYERIIDIVQNLKSFSRIDAKPSKGPYDINKGIESSLVVARNEYKYCAEVELRLGELPSIKAAGGEINQVILNLVVNAAQAIQSQKRAEKGKILVSTRADGDAIVLEIEDDGPGVPESRRMQIFDPFFTTKEPGKGTGLGLTISHDIIVRKHGGSLTVRDSSLGGALFAIRLPIEGGGADDEADRAANAGGAGG
jgi:PAS domain S-box